MKTLKQNDVGRPVSILKGMLRNIGLYVTDSDILDKDTIQSVKQFQSGKGLQADGIIGVKTWSALFVHGYSYKLSAKDRILENNEYFQEYVPKNAIYLHHTAGAHRPDYTIDWWEQDNQPGKLNRVGTSFVIGRKSNTGDTTFDGKTFRAFPEFYWAHHLGLNKNHNNTSLEKNVKLNAASIGIEICSLGPLHKETEELYYFLSRENKRINVPQSDVCILEKPWRGSLYFQKYTDKQIAECKRLILTLAFLFDIPIPQRTYTPEWFEINEEAFNGISGIWTHCNVRHDKTDCFPQPEFITMLNSLYDDFQTFTPTSDGIESFDTFNPNVEYHPKEVINYSEDLIEE